MESKESYTANRTRKKRNSKEIPVKEKPKENNYNQQHLRQFLLSRPAISISFIENLCKLPKDTLRHFLKDRRNIPLKFFGTVEKNLLDYGYTSLESE